MKKLAKRHLLVIDDWLRDPMTPEQSRLVLDPIDDRFRRRSSLLTGQLPVTAGINNLKMPPSPTPSWTAWCMTLIDSNWKEDL